MRIRHTIYSGDWSSDVCYSDLLVPAATLVVAAEHREESAGGTVGAVMRPATFVPDSKRSEERRVGKENASRGSTSHWSRFKTILIWVVARAGGNESKCRQE